MTLVVHTISEARQQVVLPRRSGGTIGLVPTMGALHAGHARLIEAARAESDFVVVSIFVNPLQFGPGEDFSRYPRTMTSDLEVCTNQGADLVFAPPMEALYPTDQLTFVDVTRISDRLCGQFRPGHFRGVATVVSKLLNVLQPDRAYFGEKDYQQLAAIRRMVSDLNMPVFIAGVPTVREPDGLAISSRNRYLDNSQRQVATTLYRGLLYAQELIRTGEKHSALVRERAMEYLRQEPGIRVEYFDIVDADEIQPITGIISSPVRIAGAIWVGNTRLIDNLPA
jgi:pantoate--beta-alanine ligase